MFVLPLARSASLVRRAPRAVALDSTLSRLLDTSFDRYVDGAESAAETRTPAMDVAESDAAFTITFDVPGARRDQLKVSVEGRRVALSMAVVDAAPAEPAADDRPAVPKPNAATAERLLYRERRPAHFARTVSLPAEVDQAASEAKFDNGVLTLVLAKKVPAGATQLRIT